MDLSHWKCIDISFILGASDVSYPGSDFETQQQKWQSTYAQRFPDLVEEVENPPDVSHRTAAHMESLVMEKLVEGYIAQHPQVWQTTTTEPGTKKPDLMIGMKLDQKILAEKSSDGD